MTEAKFERWKREEKRLRLRELRNQRCGAKTMTLESELAIVRRAAAGRHHFGHANTDLMHTKAE
jgi:hypothetical protein